MDRRERFEDVQEAMLAALDGRQAQMWTAIPGIVQSFDATEGTVEVQPAIKGRIQQLDGTVKDVTMPKLIHCPVQFPSGGGYSVTFPVKKGDECTVVFSSRCIDTWWDKGGVQTQAEMRMHDLSDGIAFLGTRSKKNALKDVSKDTVQIRSDDGKTHIELASGTVNIISDKDTTVTAKGKVTLDVAGDISISAKGKTTIHAGGDVDLTAGGNVTLNGGGAQVARVGDVVSCPAGIGHITSGAAKVLA